MLHDGTKHKTTYRIAQKGVAFAKMLSLGIKRLGGRAMVTKHPDKYTYFSLYQG